MNDWILLLINRLHNHQWPRFEVIFSMSLLLAFWAIFQKYSSKGKKQTHWKKTRIWTVAHYASSLILPTLLGSKEIVWQADLNPPFAIHIKLNDQYFHLDGLLHLEATFQYPSSYQLDPKIGWDQLVWSANPLNPQILFYPPTLSYSQENEREIQIVKIDASPLILGFFNLSFLTIHFTPKNSSQPIVTVSTPVFQLEALPLPIPSILTPAQLASLETQFPLELTRANRQLLIENPQRIEQEKRHNQSLMQKHTFPWLTLLICLGCGGGIGIGYLLFKYWLKSYLKPKKMSLSPKIKALHTLKELEKKNLISQGQIQAHYNELSSILRTLMQEQWNLPITRMTTQEIIQNSTQYPLPNKSKEDILLFLTYIDQMRFANKISSPENMFKSYQQLHNLIDYF